MNFKKYYINGNRFTIEINFRTEMYWNEFMHYLTRLTTPKPSISELIYKEMVKNPPELEFVIEEPSITESPKIDPRKQMEIIRRNLIK